MDIKTFLEALQREEINGVEALWSSDLEMMAITHLTVGYIHTYTYT